ncbi:MAG TPA: biotin transporter BioY [Halanaerobiales bacterium]|nr:biotin transporter BioY [Halanaerobiales bacterium]
MKDNLRISNRELVLTALFTTLTIIGAFIRIPLPYVSITIQNAFVFMAGLLLRKKMAALSQLLYIVIGLLGIPIFSEGGGLAYIFKPTFGYLLGFIAAAYLIGLLAENREIDFKNTVLISLSGIGVIYLFGVPYLYLVLKIVMGVEIAFPEAIKTGMIAFLPGDFLKALFVAAIAPRLSRNLKQG